MTTIRVLRILEYTYTDTPRRSAAEAMANDISHWNLGATATQQHGGTRVKSATLLPETVPDGEGSDVEGPERWFEAVEVPRAGAPQGAMGYVPGELKER